MSLLQTFRDKMAGSSRSGPVDFPILPEEPFLVIGDIHGNLPRFQDLLAEIETRYPDEKIICVGDYIDRGIDSASVLNELYWYSTEAPDDFVCLAGNHEAMLLKFLDDPLGRGRAWLKHGGLQTLESYGVAHRGSDHLEATRDALVGELGERLISWLRGLRLYWKSGNVAVVHAAADPSASLEAQERRVLQWGHPEFTRIPRSDETWIVHGHVVVPEPMIEAGRVAIDTGAYATERLTAARVSSGEIMFLSASR